MSSVVDRFIRYVRIDTQSAPDQENSPSTAKQLDLSRLLVAELTALGLTRVQLDDKGFVTATLPGNTGKPTPVIGLIAHVDTTPDFSGCGVNPQFVRNYDGGDIVLQADPKIVLSPRDFPELLQYRGQTLITTDGTTLLGADDKAGVAEIMAALQLLVENPHLPHPTVRVAFTPDEEVGVGATRFDVDGFGADFAYTVDGGELGDLSFETFNAAGARLTVHGRGVHPGSAKGKMIHAANIVHEFLNMIPADERAETTEGREGFYHLTHLDGGVEEAHAAWIIRDHDSQKFLERKQLLQNCTARINERYGAGTAALDLRDQYYNMREQIEKAFHIVETAQEAMLQVGVQPLVSPIRGGTDGAQFSFRGLPTPNLFTGGHNYHGKYEYVVVESMEKSVEVIVKILELYAAR